VQDAPVHRRFGLFFSALAISVLVAVPISLALAGLLLPGDPDDPNTKALALAIAAMLPFGLAAAGTYALVAHLLAADWEARSRLGAHVRTATPLSVACLLLLLAWKVAYATPAPETAAQSVGSPYLWREGGLRMMGCALVLLMASAVLAIPNGWRTRTGAPQQLRIEDRP
jgi:hypothetical protein